MNTWASGTLVVENWEYFVRPQFTVAQSSFSFLAFNIDSLVRSKTRKPRRMSFRGFSTPCFPFCTTPKTENSKMKTSDFSLKHFDQTMSTLIKLPKFSSSDFFILHHTQNGKLGVWSKCVEPGGGGNFLMSGIRVCATDQGRFFTYKNPEQAPTFWSFTSEQALLFWSFTPEQDPFLTIWSPKPQLKCQNQLLSSFVSCSLMSSFLFCKVFQAFYNWDQFESGHMYSSLNLTWIHHCG